MGNYKHAVAIPVRGSDVSGMGRENKKAPPPLFFLFQSYLTHKSLLSLPCCHANHHQGEIGLGEEMEDMLAKAAGGSSVPKFIKDTGNEQLIGAFKFLGSDSMTGPGSEALFVEKYGETLYREAGFTETAEKINGRLAQVGFVLALQNTFNGDVLDLMARYPLLVAIVVSGIAAASLVPVANPQGYFPDALKGSVMKAYEGVGGGDIFSEKAEIINGRAAMLGMGIFIATATIF